MRTRVQNDLDVHLLDLINAYSLIVKCASEGEHQCKCVVNIIGELNAAVKLLFGQLSYNGYFFAPGQFHQFDKFAIGQPVGKDVILPFIMICKKESLHNLQLQCSIKFNNKRKLYETIT